MASVDGSISVDKVARKSNEAWMTLRQRAADLWALRRSGTDSGVKTGPWMEPVLVRGVWGRVGSTLLMQLLGTSPEISFDRAYPCENRCLANLLRYLEPLSGQVKEPHGYWMEDPDELWWVDPASFGYQITGMPLSYPDLGVDRHALHREAVVGVWRAYSSAVSSPSHSTPRFYAEKYAGYASALSDAGISFRWMDLVRDPRDVWCSVLAFDRKRGFFGFGRREEQSEEAYLESFLRTVGRRMDEMASTSAAPALTVRYEDLVADLPGEAARIGAWLGVDLDAAAALAMSSELGHHRTAASTDESIGRWRYDLEQNTIRRIEAALGHHFERYGYTAG